jgi:hypothetical protein
MMMKYLAERSSELCFPSPVAFSDSQCDESSKAGRAYLSNASTTIRYDPTSNIDAPTNAVAAALYAMAVLSVAG